MLTDPPRATYPTHAPASGEEVTGRHIEPNQQCVEIARERLRLRRAEHRDRSYPGLYDPAGWEARERDHDTICRNERHFRDRGGATYTPGEALDDGQGY